LADLRNHFVKFRVSDIYLPESHVVLAQLHGNDLLEGKVVDTSDSGIEESRFVVVEVDGVRQLIVVPVDRIVCVGG
jgi:hypothetical protein